MRKSREGEVIVFVVNATPVVRYNYHIGAPAAGYYREIINTDAETYGGSNVGNLGGINTTDEPWQGRGHSLYVNLPPLATVAFKKESLAS
jgi:1,4-alpha-glucan branching enzyme